jgi:hypothetical protein
MLVGRLLDVSDRLADVERDEATTLALITVFVGGALNIFTWLPSWEMYLIVCMSLF